MSADFETHERGTAEELRILRKIAVEVDRLLRSDADFSLRGLSGLRDVLRKFYSSQENYVGEFPL